MKLNHTNLSVPDVSATSRFFQDYFGFQHLESKGGVIELLRDEAGFVLAISNFERSDKHEYPRDFHVGFILDTRAQVDELYQHLKEGGHANHAPRTMHGGWSFYAQAPGGVTVEIGSYAIAS